MKKWLFNVTIGGFYLCSVVLGIAMALTIGLAACDAWDYGYDQYRLTEETTRREYPGGGFIEFDMVDVKVNAVNYDTGVCYPKGDKRTEEAWVKLKKRYDRLWEIQHYLPMTDLWDYTSVLYSYSFGDSGYLLRYGELWLATAAIMTVVLSVMIMEGKAANKAWRQKMLQAFGLALFIILICITYQCAWHRVYGELSTVSVLVPAGLVLIPAMILKKTRSPKKAEAEAEVVNPNMSEKIVIPPGKLDA